jgi:hypothetical protein
LQLLCQYFEINISYSLKKKILQTRLEHIEARPILGLHESPDLEWSGPAHENVRLPLHFPKKQTISAFPSTTSSLPSSSIHQWEIFENQSKRREENRMALSFEETNLLYSQLRSEQIPFDEIVTEFLNKINRSRSSPLSASLLLLLQASNALPFNLSLSLSHLLNLLILLGFS